MKGKEVTLRTAMMVFGQLAFLGCTGTFFTELTKDAINKALMWASLIGTILSTAYTAMEYIMISEGIKKRKK